MRTVGELSPSQNQTITTLIEKKGRNKRLVKTWRPISLTNVSTRLKFKTVTLGMNVKR